MEKKIRKTVSFLGMFFGFLLKAGFVFATLEVPLPGLKDDPDIGAYVCYLFGQLTNIAIIIAVITVAFGGVYYLISYGRGKFTSEGKEWVKAGILGLLIVVCAALIAYTINPNLTKCSVGVLSVIKLNIPGSNAPTTPNIPTTTYKEIPIGTLTENLLTRATDCYGFTQEGNPINGGVATNDNCTEQNQNCPNGEQCDTATGKCDTVAPTYMDHDRADCLTQLIDGAQKKAQVIAGLSDEINKLMNTCSCRIKNANGNDTGESKCSPDSQCGSPTRCPGGTCAPPSPDSCHQPPETTDCCPAGVKDQIEHGPISMSVDVGGSGGQICTTQTANYNGLDEFRCPNPIKDDHASCDDIVSFVEKQAKINNTSVTLIDQDKWRQLNLIQQLIYFKQKINKANQGTIAQKIQSDKNVLTQAKSALGQCYWAIPYVDLLKTYTTTNQQTRLILKDPETFYDSQTNLPINVSKYCTGFNYANSSCLKECNDMCPDTSAAAINAYKSCQNCPEGGEKCMEQQEACIEKAYKSRPCTNGYPATTNNGNGGDIGSACYGNSTCATGETCDPSTKTCAVGTSKNFAGCINSCQNNCQADCGKKYLPCSAEYNFCQSQCSDNSGKSAQGNSQCVLNNAESCLFGAQNIQQCANQITDQDNTNYCINNAYLCKNGSNEYAGYKDCANPSSSTCLAYGYSASSFYDHPECRKCTNSNLPAPKTSPSCYVGPKSTASCQTVCPEVAKCPTSSKCPNCPCDQINQKITFSVPNTSTPNSTDPNYNPGYYADPQLISAHEMVGPQCNGYSYNDDPLTFYCEDNILQNPIREGLSNTPLGTDFICPKSGEVPVGQTVDNAISWANTLISSADKMNQDIQKIIDGMIKSGKAKDTAPIQDYCKCNAKLESNAPICKTNCQYYQFLTPDGWVCGCAFVPCKGSPCQQVIDYLSDIWNAYRQLKLDFIDFYTYMVKEPRSDIMKELTYSRQTTNQCSAVNTIAGPAERMLNCTRVENEIISPINNNPITIDAITTNGCYGGQGNGHLGALLGISDNWFCCQQYSATPMPNSNPIYNTNTQQ